MLLKEKSRRPVAFVYLSFDEDAESWKKAAQKYEVKYNSYLLEGNFKAMFPKIIQLRSIPRYVLIDKTGKIISEDAPRPEKPELKKMIERSISKN